MFKDKIKELRINNNLTQEELANKLYVTRNAVSKWETGNGLPSIETLMDISKKFNVSIDDLLNENDAKSVLSTTSKKVKKSSTIIYSLIIFVIYSLTSIIIPHICFTLDPTSVMAYLLIIAPFAFILIALISFIVYKKPLVVLISAAIAIIPSYIYFDLNTNVVLGFYGIIFYIIFAITYLLLFVLYCICNKKALKILKIICLSVSSILVSAYLFEVIYAIITYSPFSYSIPLYSIILIKTLFYFLPIAFLILLFIMFHTKERKDS